MNASPEPTATPDPIQLPSSGVGPMMQRDYWAVVDGSRCTPSQVVAMVASRFPEFPPTDVVVFERDAPDADPGVLEVGDELDLDIRLAGPARVRVIHTCPCSITLATLHGHPEAGRITFGAYRNGDGQVVFHIRSRARSSSLFSYLGFLVGGNPMQTTTWTDFVNNVAITCGDGVAGGVQAETKVLGADELEPGDESMDGPTFVAEGD